MKRRANFSFEVDSVQPLAFCTLIDAIDPPLLHDVELMGYGLLPIFIGILIFLG